MSGAPDADEAELWLRNPVTKWLIQRMNHVPAVSKYREATDVISLGHAQGYDDAITTFNRLIGELERTPRRR